MILEGDSLEVLKTLEDNSVDTVITDPPYGYSFMGKDWDKAVPSIEIWQECLRVLKPGAFMCVMSAPRSDVQCAMISRLQEAGFRLDFTPIYWTYASGFPKAGDVAKLAMKKLGDKGEVSGTRKVDIGMQGGSMHAGRSVNVVEQETFKPTDERIIPLQSAKTGFQPKPAVEVIIVAMKPLSEKTYVDQALANGHGVSWLDDARIPTAEALSIGTGDFGKNGVYGKAKGGIQQHEAGRFPANLLVSDDVLNDGTNTKGSGVGNRRNTEGGEMFGGGLNSEHNRHADSGSYSRYFDLDKWSQTLPFLIVPKASKSEKNKGLEHFEEKIADVGDDRPSGSFNERLNHPAPLATKNHHPTVKPLKLMSYLITLFSRPGDTVLDPFVGSGTTIVAAKQLGREGIGIEREAEYAEIARARYAHIMPQLPPELPVEGQPPIVISEAIKDNEQLRLV